MTDFTYTKPYEGENKYIFISYCHDDKEIVLPIINELIKRGYRIWYDEGINVGEDWPEVVAQHLEDCSLFIAFVTENFVLSKNCKREVNYAVDSNLEMFALYFNNVKLTPGLKLQLGTIQSIMLNKYQNTLELCKKIFENDLMKNKSLIMSIDEFNEFHTITNSSTLVYELTIAIGICKYNNKVAMVKRATKEGNLLWQFPAGVIKPSETVERKIIREVYQETGLKTSFNHIIGTRIHPDTKTLTYYCALDYVSGEITNGDDYENEEAKWVNISEYKEYITSNIFEKVKQYIEGEK